MFSQILGKQIASFYGSRHTLADKQGEMDWMLLPRSLHTIMGESTHRTVPLVNIVGEFSYRAVSHELQHAST